MADIVDYASLKVAILRLLERTNDERAAVLLPQWVAQAEEDIAAQVRAPWMMQAAENTIDEAWEELPPDFIRIGDVLVKVGSSYWPLQSASLTQIAPYLEQPGTPQLYCIENFSLTVAPASPPLTLRYTFWLREQPLTADSDTNVTLMRASGCYLYGAARHACVHYEDDAGLMRYDAAFARALSQANDLLLDWAGGDGIAATMTPRRNSRRLGVIDHWVST